MHTQFAQFARDIETGCLRLKNEGRDAATASLRSRFGIDDQQAGNRAIRNEHFSAVEQVAALSWPRRHLDAHSVGARIRFGESQSTDHLGAREFRKVSLFLFFSAIAQNVMGTEIQMRPVRHRNGAIRASDGASHQRCHQEIATAAAILFGDGYASIALLGQSFPDPGGKVVCTFDLLIMWFDFILRKSKRAFISQLMLFRQFKIHGWRSILSGVNRVWSRVNASKFMEELKKRFHPAYIS